MKTAVLIFSAILLQQSVCAQAAEEFLQANAVLIRFPNVPEDFDATSSKIEVLPDPESKFGYIVFSLARHSEKLFTPEQSEKLAALIDARKNAPVNWHDVRNMVRVRAQVALWDYAGETDAATAEKKQKVWRYWNNMRIEYMFQEFVDKERFQRAAWDLLTESQIKKLRSGEWDQYLKKNTGHRRLFSADKQISRVLGKPDKPEVHASKTNELRNRWDIMWQAYQAASAFERKREWNMDLSDEAFAIYSWKNSYLPRFREFSELECTAIRELLQASYTIDRSATQKLKTFQEKLRADARKKYAEAPEELLAILQ